jgi:hypothetical protein
VAASAVNQIIAARHPALRPAGGAAAS